MKQSKPGEIISPNLEIEKQDFDYPSVSKIINHKPNSKLIKWRKEVGEDIANYIVEQSAKRGSETHEIIEAYLKNEKHEVVNILPTGLFNSMKHYIDRINNIKLLEETVVSHKLKIQGRVDCIANYGDELSVIEFKTVRNYREKPKAEWCLQCTAYALMYEEFYGTRINDFIIICAGEDNSIIVFRRQVEKYIKPLEDLIKSFNNKGEDDGKK